jgi:histidyl-tRNA synthetase
MSKIRPLSGFPELLPRERIVEQRLTDVLREVFELHGFASIETRAVEPLDQLLHQGETDKEIYTLRRLHGADDDESSTARLGLHYDLTVPLARYVLEHAGQLDFPFRRYQIQKAWRGERPQEGRYREFTQADIDVIGRDSLSFVHEIEVAQVMADVFARLPLPPVTMQVNSRRLIEGFYRGLGIESADVVAGAMRVVDKLDKIGAAEVARQLVGTVGLTDVQAKSCLQLTGITATADDLESQVAGLGVRHPLLDEGVAELARVLAGVRDLSSPHFSVVADLRIARGLDYYTGTVYELRMAGLDLTMCAGGRYDALATDGRTTYPGVGLSFGISRTLVPLLARGDLTASRATPTAVLVALANDDARANADVVARLLRGRGVPVEISPSAAKYGKQIRYAERRGIPFVWFPQDDGSHQVRDIRSGLQVVADLNTWAPPPDDLRPSISKGSP